LADVLRDPDFKPAFSSHQCAYHPAVVTVPQLEKMWTSTRCWGFFRAFTHVTQFSVLVEQLVPGIVQALAAEEDMATEVLPKLTRLLLMLWKYKIRLARFYGSSLEHN
jgi:hypothetical protein